MAKYIITPEGKRVLQTLKSLNTKIQDILEAAEDGVLDDEEVRTLRLYTKTLNKIEGMGLIRRID